MLYLRTISRRQSLFHLYAMTAAKCSDAKSGHSVHERFARSGLLPGRELLLFRTQLDSIQPGVKALFRYQMLAAYDDRMEFFSFQQGIDCWLADIQDLLDLFHRIGPFFFHCLSFHIQVPFINCVYFIHCCHVFILLLHFPNFSEEKEKVF